MNRRQKKKHALDIAAVKLARSMEDWKYLDKRERKAFVKICKRAVMDNFPLNEFFIFEIPVCYKNFWVFVFFGQEYNKENPNQNEFRQIDFWIYTSKKRPNKIIVTPAAVEEEKVNCFEAVYYS